MDKAFYFKLWFTKVKQQSDMMSGCFEVVNALRNMDLINTFHRLDFNDETLINKQVCDIFTNHLTSILNTDGVLLDNF